MVDSSRVRWSIMKSQVNGTARREASWSAWCTDMLSVAALPHGLAERTLEIMSRFVPDEATATALSQAYGERTTDSARDALRATLRAVSTATSQSFARDACVLLASELMQIELAEEEDQLEGLRRHGVECDSVMWSNAGPVVREPDGPAATRALLTELLGLPRVRVDVRDLALSTDDGIPSARLAEELRRLWSTINGSGPTVPEGPSELSTLLGEVRALRSELGRHPGPYQAGTDWLEDAISGLPHLLNQGEAAKALGVHPRTVRRMIRRGELKSVDLGVGGRGRSCGVRIPRGAVAELLRRKVARDGRTTAR